jgi:D-sedoheptulose 7-phosphate isomerase
VKAAEYVKEVGATLIGFTGYDGGKLHKMADYHVHIPADDMQLAEDGHMIAVHFMMQIFWKRLMAENGKKAVYKVNK